MQRNKRYSIAMLIGCFFVILLAMDLLPRIQHARVEAKRRQCQLNLKEISVYLKAYAAEHDGVYPPLHETPGRIMFSLEGIDVPKDIQKKFCCPAMRRYTPSMSQDECVDDHDFYYISHAVLEIEEIPLYVKAYRQAVEQGESFDRDFVLPDGRVLYRLHEDIASNEDILGRIPKNTMNNYTHPEIDHTHHPFHVKSMMPILIERRGNHTPYYTSVLFLDGHIETFYAEMYPDDSVYENYLDALESID